MADKEGNALARWWAGIRDRAQQSVVTTQGTFALGKVAGVPVTDSSGRILVEAGQRIDEAALARARQAGRVAALATSVMKARTQDFKDKAQRQYAKTQSQQEARLLESVEDYREARNYRGRMLTMDVTDIRGNVIIPASKELDEEDIRKVRDAGLLAAFLVAAERSVPAQPNQTTAAPIPFAATVPIPKSGPVRLGDSDDEDE